MLGYVLQLYLGFRNKLYAPTLIQQKNKKCFVYLLFWTDFPKFLIVQKLEFYRMCKIITCRLSHMGSGQGNWAVGKMNDIWSPNCPWKELASRCNFQSRCHLQVNADGRCTSEQGRLHGLSEQICRLLCPTHMITGHSQAWRFGKCAQQSLAAKCSLMPDWFHLKWQLWRTEISGLVGGKDFNIYLFFAELGLYSFVNITKLPWHLL